MCCNLGKLWLPIKVSLVIALIGREQRVHGSRGSPTPIRWLERKVPASIPSTFDRRASKHDAYTGVHARQADLCKTQHADARYSRLLIGCWSLSLPDCLSNDAATTALLPRTRLRASPNGPSPQTLKLVTAVLLLHQGSE